MNVTDLFGFDEMNRLELTFAVCAAVGGTLFIVRMVLFTLGMGGDDMDADLDADGDAGFGGLSIHGITAFFMMFGLVGLAMSRGSGQGAGLSVVVAILAGVASLLISSQLFRAFRRMQQTGTIDYSSAIGEEGTVYLSIAKGGVGRVQLNVGGRSRIMDARSEDGTEVSTGDRVRVQRLVEGNVLVVETISS